MSKDDRTREAIGRTAVKLRHEAAKNGIPMTQTQARERVAGAVERDKRRNPER